MMSLIFTSSLVSLLTLAILLFRRSRPQKQKIPSALLGATKAFAPLRLKLTTPPWLLWLFVILITLGLCLAYFPHRIETQTHSGKSALLWVDSSLSATLARIEHKANPAELSSLLTKEGFSYYGILPSDDTQNSDEPVSFVELRSANDIGNFLTKVFAQRPSIFARPLPTDAVIRFLQNSTAFSDRSGILVTISDGQSETLANLQELKPWFAGARLLQLHTPTFAPQNLEEVAPTPLAALWKTNVTAKTDFFVYDDELKIPLAARPHLFRQEILPDFKVIASDRGTKTPRLVMLTACTPLITGPMELDPFSDVRMLTQFFSTTLRLRECRERSENLNLTAENDPWKYRSESIWIVPLTETVTNTFSQRLWIPSGFQEGSDALVYVANAQTQQSQTSTRTPVQLEEGNIQVPLFLAPPAPQSDLVYELQNNSETAAIRTTFRPSYWAADKTPLAYKANGLPLYYLRTTTAMPNGELGRSSQWSQFWLDVSTQTHANVKGILSRSFMDPASLAYEIKTFFADDELKEFLNPQSLNFEAKKFDRPQFGIYRSASGKLLLVGVPESEYSKVFVDSESFENEWSSGKGAAAENEPNTLAQKKPIARAVFGAALALLATLLLWMRERRSVAPLLLFLFFFSFNARAQGFPFSFKNLFRTQHPQKTIAVPYRVSWCDAEVPESVTQRYEELRDLLGGRGTIDLPEKLLAGACRPGASEIWWASDPLSLPTQLTQQHIAMGGVFVLEGQNDTTQIPANLVSLADASIGLAWGAPPKRGLLYRSFYLLQTFDGCTEDKTKWLDLRKKINAHSPVAIVTKARFLTSTLGGDCFIDNEDYRSRSFVNMMYSLLATDYKEDQLQLPEILNRVRNLGLEP